MAMDKLRSTYDRVFAKVELLKHPVLLLLRVVIGGAFFHAGYGKLQNVARTAGFFEQMGIPLPELNAYLVGGTEMIGGLLLLVGLASRLAAIPLSITMIVAQLTAHYGELKSLFYIRDGVWNPAELASSGPFPYLAVSLIVLCYGPGCWSLDCLIRRLTTPGGRESQGDGS